MRYLKKAEVGVPWITGWLTLAHPAIAEIMCRSHLNSVVIDLEHNVISRRETEDLIRVVDLHDKQAWVRLSGHREEQIKWVMDAGAHGIIVPNVKSPEEAAQAVQNAKYPPTGTRGVGLARAQGYGDAFLEYKEWAENSSLVIAQIEHIDAIQSLEEIVSTPGIDGTFLGPYDLSASLGRPGSFKDKAFISARERLLEVMKERRHQFCGIHVIQPDPEEVSERINEGFNLVAYSTDMLMLQNGFRSGLELVHQQLQGGNQ